MPGIPFGYAGLSRGFPYLNLSEKGAVDKPQSYELILNYRGSFVSVQQKLYKSMSCLPLSKILVIFSFSLSSV